VNTARAGLVVRVVAILTVVVGLGVDAYVHFDLAPTYDAIKSSTLSQGDLFRAEGVAAVLAALAVVVRSRRWTAALAFLVAAGGLTAVLVYRYVNVGAVGPLPSMYEPVWYTEKTQSAWAEAAATLASVVLFVALHVRSRQPAAAGASASSRLSPANRP
jgi:hypothetical protein